MPLKEDLCEVMIDEDVKVGLGVTVIAEAEEAIDESVSILLVCAFLFAG